MPLRVFLDQKTEKIENGIYHNFGVETMKKSIVQGSQISLDGSKPEQPTLFHTENRDPSFPYSEPEEEEQEIPEGEHRHYVYAWRWRSDEKYAKIGRTRNGLMGVKNRMVATYNPTDDPFLLGVKKCDDMEDSIKTEKDILDKLTRTLPKREWVEIDDEFNKMINESFKKMGNDEL